MNGFEEFYNLFLQTQNAQKILAEIKRARPALSDKQLNAAAKNMAQTAFILKDEGYFNPNVNEGMVSRNWNNIFRSLAKCPPRTINTAKTLASRFQREIMPLCRNEREEALARSAFARIVTCADGYKPKICSKEEFQNRLFAVCSKIFSSPKLSLADKFSLSADVFSDIYLHKPDTFLHRLDMFEEAFQKIDDVKKLKYICTETDAFFINEGNICSQAVKGFRENYLPFVSQTEDYANIAAEHDCNSGEYGTIGYIFKTAASEWNSPNLCEIMCLAREVPTTDMLKRKVIRDAAITLDGGKFIGLRDAIHGESVGINELLDSMSVYYDAAAADDKDTKSAAKRKIAQYLKNLKSEEFAEEYYNLENYEEVLDWENNLRAVDLIKTIRIDENDEKAPLCGIAEIDVPAQRFCAVPDSSVLLFGNFLKKLNNQIMKNMEEHKIGFDPKMVDLMLWCDKKAARILDGRPDFETQCGDYKTGWFKEILRFSDLTFNPDFNNEDFEKYYEQLTNMGADAYKRIAERQTDNLKKAVAFSEQKEKAVIANWKAVQKICGREDTAHGVNNLKKIFHTRREYLWSDNLLKETMSIAGNFKEPSTRIGERYHKRIQQKIAELPMEDMMVKLFNFHKGKGL